MVADFASLVFDAYRDGDTAAATILERHAAVIAEQITCGAQKLDCDCPEAVLVGGLMRQADCLLPLIKKHLSISCNITPFRGSVIRGALRLAGLGEDNA